jgi:hypothetical protein
MWKQILVVILTLTALAVVLAPVVWIMTREVPPDAMDDEF